MTKVCADCKFHAEVEGKHKCTAIIDLVTGIEQDIECQEARMSAWLCGTDAKLYKEADGVAEKRVLRERERVKAEPARKAEARDEPKVSRNRDSTPARSDG